MNKSSTKKNKPTSEPNIIQDDSETQLSLELHEPISNTFYNYKGKFDKSLRQFETQKFVRSWVVWFTFIFSITAILIQTYYLLTKFSTLPNIVPVLNMYITLQNTLVNKEMLFGFPMFSTIITITSFYISSSTHNKNNIAALINLTISTLSIITLTFTLIQLIAIYNV
jgi:hypothetical protein